MLLSWINSVFKGFKDFLSAGPQKRNSFLEKVWMKSKYLYNLKLP